VRLTAGLFAIGVVLLAPRPGLACVCTDTGSVADEWRASGAVFLGRIVGLSIEAVKLEDIMAERMRASFKVERRWKGPKGPTIDVWTCGDQVEVCTCGVDFNLGERYVVFASGKPLGTGSCDRTRVLSAAESIVAELDKLSPAERGRTTR
jgi:hypothetical protein